MRRYRRQCRQLVLEVLEQRRLLADDVDGGGTDALPLLPDDMPTVEENKPLRDDLTSLSAQKARAASPCVRACVRAWARLGGVCACGGGVP